MSLSDYFRKKSSAVLASTTVALAAAGGYAGLQLGQGVHTQLPTSSVVTTQTKHPSLSILTLSQQTQDSIEGRVSEKIRLQETGADTEHGAEVATFVRMIERMEQDAQEMDKTIDDIARIKTRAPNIVSETNVGDILRQKEERLKILDAVRQEMGERFVNGLRASSHLTEVDYSFLTGAFDARAGVSVPARVGNYRAGAMYNQECQMAIGFANAFSGGDDDAQVSADVGNCMKDLFDNPQQIKETKEKIAQANGVKLAQTDKASYAVGTGGAVLGGLLTVPFWLRRRQPKI